MMVIPLLATTCLSGSLTLELHLQKENAFSSLSANSDLKWGIEDFIFVVSATIGWLLSGLISS